MVKNEPPTEEHMSRSGSTENDDDDDSEVEEDGKEFGKDFEDDFQPLDEAELSGIKLNYLILDLNRLCIDKMKWRSVYWNFNLSL